jgi:hypothetical protein
MLDWWAHNGPPAYASVAGYLGLIKDRPKKGSSTAKPDKPVGGDLNELLKFAGPGGMIH